ELFLQLRQPNFLRSNPIDGGQMPHQYKVTTVVAARLLEREHISGGSHYAYHAGVASRISAHRAHLLLSKIAALLTLANTSHSRHESWRQLLASLAMTLKQIIGHAMSRLRPHAGQASESIDELLDQWTLLH